MAHQLVKTLLLAKVSEIIAAQYKISISEARERLYQSDVIKFIDDDELGLYGESPWYIFSLFELEKR